MLRETRSLACSNGTGILGRQIGAVTIIIGIVEALGVAIVAGPCAICTSEDFMGSEVQTFDLLIETFKSYIKC